VENSLRKRLWTGRKTVYEKIEWMNEYKHLNVAAARRLDTASLKHGTYWRNNMNMWIGSSKQSVSDLVFYGSLLTF
jgi:hypothetical protein